MLLDFAKEAAVLVDAPDLGTEGGEDAFIFGAEALGTELVGEAEPPVSPCQRAQRCEQKCPCRGVAVRQADVRALRVFVEDPPRTPLCADFAQQSGFDARPLGRIAGQIEPAGREQRRLAVGRRGNCQHRIFRAHQVTRGVTDPLQKHPRVAFRRELYVELDQRGKTGVCGA